MKCRSGIRNQECVQVRRSYKLIRLLFQLFEQIPTHFSKRMCHAKIQRAEINQGESSILDEISGLAIIKILDGSTYSTVPLKLKFMHNAATLDRVNNGPDTIMFKPEEMLGTVDLRHLGYYKIKQGIQQQNLSKYYKFKGQIHYVNILINS